MEPTTPPQDGLLVPAAAALVGLPELDVRKAIAEGDIPHAYRIVVASSDVQTWARDRASRADS